MILHDYHGDEPIIGLFKMPDGLPQVNQNIEVEGRPNWHRVMNIEWHHVPGKRSLFAELADRPAMYEAHVFVVEIKSLPVRR